MSGDLGKSHDGGGGIGGEQGTRGINEEEGTNRGVGFINRVFETPKLQYGNLTSLFHKAASSNLTSPTTVGSESPPIFSTPTSLVKDSNSGRDTPQSCHSWSSTEANGKKRKRSSTGSKLSNVAAAITCPMFCITDEEKERYKKKEVRAIDLYDGTNLSYTLEDFERIRDCLCAYVEFANKPEDVRQYVVLLFAPLHIILN